jgi:uncharacterized protein (DUF1778 family)
MPQAKNARFDAKLPEAQKSVFERAAKIGGYRTLTDFVVSSAQEKADEIIEQHEQILASEEDREVFFNAVLNPPEPNDKLQKAVKDYKAELLG